MTWEKWNEDPELTKARHSCGSSGFLSHHGSHGISSTLITGEVVICR
jgi:hypothetical protein